MKKIAFKSRVQQGQLINFKNKDKISTYCINKILWGSKMNKKTTALIITTAMLFSTATSFGTNVKVNAKEPDSKQ